MVIRLPHQALLEPNKTLALNNPNRGTWERIEGEQLIKINIYSQSTKYSKLVEYILSSFYSFNNDYYRHKGCG